MKRRITLFLIICGLMFFCSSPAKATSDVVIQVASTHQPTKEFQDFAKEFLIAFSELCAADLVPTLSNDESPKIFYLIERRDQGQWRIGVCKLLENGSGPILGFSSAKMSFTALWIIEGNEIKKAGKRRALAGEAAKFLFLHLFQKGA